ncbi:unnamed protein product [Caenorhabditis brenneri]
MKKISDFVKSDRKQILTCIQYEVLGKLPIFESYRNFCDRLGDDVMDYIEFEFWYWRIYSGKTDFDYDRSQEPKKKTFSELPPEIFSKVVDELSPIDRIHTRQASRDLQLIVDSKKSDFTMMEFDISKKSFFCECGYFPSDRPVYTFDFRKQEKGYIVNSQGITYKIGDKDFFDGVQNAWVAVFSNLKTELKRLKVIANSMSYEEFSILLRDISKQLKTQISVETLILLADLQENSGSELLRHLMLLLKPGALQHIELEAAFGRVNYAAIAETEQWKQAKTMKTEQHILAKAEELPLFAHFDEFVQAFDEVTTTQLVDFVKILRNSENFIRCDIWNGFNAVNQFSVDDYATESDTGVRENDTVTEPILGSNKILRLFFSIEWGHRGVVTIEKMDRF